MRWETRVLTRVGKDAGLVFGGIDKVAGCDGTDEKFTAGTILGVVGTTSEKLVLVFTTGNPTPAADSRGGSDAENDVGGEKLSDRFSSDDQPSRVGIDRNGLIT